MQCSGDGRRGSLLDLVIEEFPGSNGLTHSTQEEQAAIPDKELGEGELEEHGVHGGNGDSSVGLSEEKRARGGRSERRTRAVRRVPYGRPWLDLIPALHLLLRHGEKWPAHYVWSSSVLIRRGSR